CGRLPWAILGRAFGAENKRAQEWLLSMADRLLLLERFVAQHDVISLFRRYTAGCVRNMQNSQGVIHQVSTAPYP
ncbi:MAG TPA: hypothetical protein PLE35_06505, partial [Lentisphaeria bacterium]|nr:hypothetical protein [Lentisphaeria bacterium]